MKNKQNLVFRTLLYCFLFTSLLFWQCDTNVEKMDGAALAKIHCSSCHLFPEPDALDRRSWQEYILPRMGYMLGVLPTDSIEGGFIETAAKQEAFNNPLLFRKNPTLSKKEWTAIQQYYLKNSPVELPVAEQIKYQKTDEGLFDIKFPDIYLSPPSTTYIEIKNQEIVYGDAHSRKLYFSDNKLSLKSAANAGEVPVWVNETDQAYLVTSMGAFSPTDYPVGKIIYLPKEKEGSPFILIDSLKRPVHTSISDLNQDGLFDIVTCEFAKWTGSLSWWKNNGKGHFKKSVLRNMPGAIKAYARDMNNDQLMDIVALFGQGDEGIFIYYNQGNGDFKEERVLRFPPSYGSSFFNVFDYDKDGHLDFIYTNGDNADFPPITKPYHGIRIFKNNGQQEFDEIFFQPMPGAYQAIPNDYDQDGDWDIVAISFFPDFEEKNNSSILYLENSGELNMNIHRLPYADKGRWIVMDDGDFDNDGDIDLAIGSLAFEVLPATGIVKQWTKDGIPFILLENNINK